MTSEETNKMIASQARQEAMLEAMLINQKRMDAAIVEMYVQHNKTNTTVARMRGGVSVLYALFLAGVALLGVSWFD